MRFVTDRCLQCGTPQKSAKPIIISDFWLCSTECYTEAVSKYLDKEYALDKNPFDSREMKEHEEEIDHRIDSLVPEVDTQEAADRILRDNRHRVDVIKNQWNLRQGREIAKAKAELHKRIEAEGVRQRAEQAEKERVVREKEQAKAEQELKAKEAELERLEPKPIPEDTRFSGQWIVAPPGRGKTTLLHSMILKDVNKDASVILMDSKGDLINEWRDLAFLKNRLVIIDPRNPIALNPLDVPKTNIRRAVAHLEYIFSALMEAKITPKQQSLFRSVLRALVIAFPSPTLETFRDIISNGVGKYRAEVSRLPEDLKEFFNKEFDRDYDATRNELIWRLRLLMENDFIRNMLNAPLTKLNLGREMNAGKVIIINNSQALLDKDGAEFFARFFIAQLWRAAAERTGNERPVYVYLDEAQNIIRRDETFATILDEMRSKKIAITIAHQRAAQIESKNVLSALSNCAIRMSNSDEESKLFSEVLRTNEAHLHSLQRGQFAVFVRDVTKQAFTLDVNRIDFSKATRLTPAQKAALNEEMIEKYGYKTHEGPTEAEPSRGAYEIPAASRAHDVADKAIIPKNISDPSAPARWRKG